MLEPGHYVASSQMKTPHPELAGDALRALGGLHQGLGQVPALDQGHPEVLRTLETEFILWIAFRTAIGSHEQGIGRSSRLAAGTSR